MIHNSGLLRVSSVYRTHLNDLVGEAEVRAELTVRFRFMVDKKDKRP